jgi:4-hydroxy-tetrahydrodipicolinate synthase
MKKSLYGGVIVPMITPFTREGHIDTDAIEKLVRYIVKNNCHPFVGGTTGESASIDVNDFKVIAEAMVKAADGKSKTYAGISSNNFSTSVKLAEQMQSVGVDAVVAHPPVYYPISAARILSYYEKLVEAVKMPLLMYNIPATTHHSIPLDVVETLSHHPNMVGLKDSERDLQRMKSAIKMFAGRDDFVHLLGWGAQLCNALIMGSDGIVPSTGNITPHLYYMMYQQVLENNPDSAAHVHRITDQFSQIYQKDRLLSDSLAALKVILHELNLCERSVLPPLAELNDNEVKMIVKNFNEMKEKMTTDPFGEKITWA